MTTSYTTSGPACNPTLTRPLYRTLNLLLDLTRRHSFCWATNDWLATRLNYTPRTITRHIATLARAGYITAERVANERHIRPAAAPAQATALSRKVTLRNPGPPAEMSTRCLPASIESKAKENNTATAPTEPANPIVAALEAEGVDTATAQALAKKHGDECMKHIKPGNADKNIANKAGWIVSAIRNAWKHRPKAQKVAAKPRLNSDRPATPPPPTPPDPTAQAWNALPAEQRKAIRTTVQARLHASIRHREQIIQAHCLIYLREQSSPPARLTSICAAQTATVDPRPDAPQQPAKNEERPRPPEPPPPPA